VLLESGDQRAELLEQYRASGPGDGKELAPSYNVAPTSKVYAVLERGQEDETGAERQVRTVRWGLLLDLAPWVGVIVGRAAALRPKSWPHHRPRALGPHSLITSS
jgi:putative SOS response-associated peptidase YedK